MKTIYMEKHPMQEFSIELRSEASLGAEFDETFSSYQPSASEQVKVSRIHYTKKMLQLAQLRQAEFWCAKRISDGRLLARLGADVREAYGSIGFLEAEPDEFGARAAQALLETALAWLNDRAVSTVYGPMDFNSWFNYRLKITNHATDSEEHHPWEPVSSNFYERVFRAAGFTDALKYSSHFFELSDVTQWQLHMAHLRHDHEKLQTEGYEIRPLSSGDTLENDIRSIFEISNISFSNQPMFEHIPYALFKEITLPPLTQFNSSPSRICFDSHGRPVGFMFAFLLNGLIVFKSIAVLPELQAKGIGNAMTLALCQFGLEHNVRKCVGALIRGGNRSEMFGKSFEKTVTSAGKNEYILLSRTVK